MPQRLPLKEIRRRFFEGEPLPGQALPASILRSWQRCRTLGLSAGGNRNEGLESARLNEQREQNAPWLEAAQPALSGLQRQLDGSELVLVVAEKGGLILNANGETPLLDKNARLALSPGMDWSEAARGTNAIGTALASMESVLVRGAEHYLERNRLLACAAAPLSDAQGRLLGTLDVSGASRKLGAAEARAVEAAALQIEELLYQQASRTGWRLALHADARQLDGARACRLAFGEDGRLVAANRAGRALCGIAANAWQAVPFVMLAGLSLEAWLARHGHGAGVMELCGQRLYARLTPPATPILHPAARAAPPRAAPIPAATAAAPELDGLPPALFATAKKLMAADIPVLLLGETGTGKDRLARALHAAGSRRGAPFVAVNCAAIPEGLIEAELFGYQPGAYTGASRQGSKGRLREADGGVLFLDEIGDMPLSLQARLLRVLQEREVTPLGGGASARIDIRLICATHRDLATLAQQGRFREDLYYRLCHYPLQLPPLRERGDVGALAQKLLDAGGGARRGIALAPELMQALRRYRWPGNLRELSNLLSTLLALADDGALLSLEQLPAPLAAAMNAQAAPATGDRALDELLARCNGNASAAARALGISRSTLYRRLGREKGS